MVKGGWSRKNIPDNSEDEENEVQEADYEFVYTNKQIQQILKTTPLKDFIYSQYLKYIAHVCRAENTSLTKIMLFANPQRRFYRNPWIKIAELLGVSIDKLKG